MPKRGKVLSKHVDKEVTRPEPQGTRLRAAVKQARQLIRQLKNGDREALAESVMLQGILAGDVTSAAIATKLRLQNENLRIKQRMHRQRLQLEAIKTKILAQSLPRPQPDLADVIRNIEEIYGLTYRPSNQILEATCTESQSASPPQTQAQPKSESNSETHLATPR